MDSFKDKARTFKDSLLEKWAARRDDRDENREELFVERRHRRSLLLSVFFTALKVMMVLVVLVGFACLGLVIGVAKAYIDTTPDLDVAQLTLSDQTSYIYDRNGDLITTYAGMEYRDWVDAEDIPDMLKNAIVAIEDVRFYMHDGVDYKRLFSAVINTLRNADTHGGSTLTQQLIKNKILSNEQSYKRKIQEAYLALEVETVLSKDEILEAYLNNTFFGESNYGVKTAAKDYFGKELDELSIRECAMLAGLAQKPYITNPRANTYQRFYEDGTNKMDVTDARTDVVIEAMYSAGFISLEQRDYALQDRVYILEVSEQKQLYEMPYFVEYAIYDVITHLLQERGLTDTTANRTLIENELRTGGYHIYLTVDPDIQKTVEDTIYNWDQYPKLEDSSAYTKITTNSDGTTLAVSEPQAAAVVIDQHTGELLAVVGGRDAPERKKQLNRAYQSTLPVGSSIKPLSVYGPALDMGLSPASVVYNLPAPIEGWDTDKGYPYIGSSRHIGLITLRRGVVSSLNVAAARVLLTYVGLQNSYQYMVSLGIDPSHINVGGSGLALGTSGITCIEMAAAYATIANGGVYIEPVSFSRVVDNTGKVILRAPDVQESHRVFKGSTAYMLVDILTDAVSRGTGTNAKIDGITVAGKTGTNADYSSVYFSGMTPYYTSVLWIGHDDYAKKLVSGSTGGDWAAPLWQAYMSKILEGYLDKPIIDDSPVSLGLIKSTVCSISGKLATEACSADLDGHTPVTDWFEKSTAPAEECDMHIMSSICTLSGQIASENCPSAYVSSACTILIDVESPYREFTHELLSQYMSNLIYTDYTAEIYLQLNYDASTVCTMHGSSSYYQQTQNLDAAISEARNLIAQVINYLNSAQTTPDSERSTLLSNINDLENIINGGYDADTVSRFTEQLRYNYSVISAAYPPVGG